ncbi:MAG: response regulator [Chloroflexi bacterium]|nr:response regulator [Chloroflexota bacterium]
MTSEQRERFLELPAGMRFVEHLSGLSEPLRIKSMSGYLEAVGLPKYSSPVKVTSCLVAPIRINETALGCICLMKGEEGKEFSQDDEGTLATFASQAALVISNARRYQDEQRARADLEALINTSPVGVVVFDAKNGELLSINQEAKRIAGIVHTSGESIERLFETLTFRRSTGRAISLDKSTLSETLRTGEIVRAEEIEILGPDGSSVTTLVNATSIFSASEEIESVVVTVQDMTPLQEEERLRAEFLGIVGHELRLPLTSVKGSATTLLETASSLDPAELQQFYRIINEQADYMRDLISDLIDVARIETGTLSVNPEPVDVPRLVDEARNTFLSAGGRRNIRIKLAPDLPLIMADRRRVVQVLNNLLTNASRNSPETSTIRVTASRAEALVTVSVSDDGRGVPAERLPHLFRKFSHIDNRERDRDLGLGLAICKGIVEAHGGRIWAESDGPGLGSRFSFTIPLAEEAAIAAALGAARRSARIGQSSKRGQSRVLAVDDDPRTLQYIRDALSAATFHPVVTGDPREVMSLIEANEPHVVLLDLMLPGTDGIELMRDILAEYDVPIIFLSAYDQDEVIARAFEMGAVDYIVKPFSPTELAARVKAAMRKQPEPANTFTLGDLVMDYGRRSVTVAGKPVELTAIEFQFLAELSINSGIVLTHEQLLHRVWGTRGSGDIRPMRTVVKTIRNKLGDRAKNPKYIYTVPRVGYGMVEAE